jgi:hypothetical protein
MFYINSMSASYITAKSLENAIVIVIAYCSILEEDVLEVLCKRMNRPPVCRIYEATSYSLIVSNLN